MNDQKSLDISIIPAYEPRRFVPADADLTNAAIITDLFSLLAAFPLESPHEMEKFVAARSELDSAVGQQKSLLYIQMTCQTDDQGKAASYAYFIENISPIVQHFDDELNRKYSRASERIEKDPLYFVYDRAIRADMELFRQKNIELSKQEELLNQQYQSVCGAMTVEFQGNEYTFPQMQQFLLDPDRALREKAWFAISDRRLRDAAQFEEIFDKMLELRQKMTHNADLEDYQQFKFKQYHRFDYSAEECGQYADSVEKHILPILDDLYKQRADQMDLSVLRPWDIAADPLGRQPLKPFTKIEQLTSGVQEIFNRMDPVLASQFRQMQDLGLLDLGSRKGKAPGGYQDTLTEIRKPFIFMNAVGTDRDLRVLLHESGHAFHAFAAAHHAIHQYRHAPIEFCEVASMSMEMLADQHLGVFYSHEDADRSRREHLEGIVFILPWVAAIDSFQAWIYKNPSHGPDHRNAAWTKIFNRFAKSIVNWDGLEEYQQRLWHRQLHLFQCPFYYIEYGIAQLGALQIWQRSKENLTHTLNEYRNALALGGSQPLPDLFAAAGLKFDFSDKTVVPLAGAVKHELKNLGK